MYLKYKTPFDEKKTPFDEKKEEKGKKEEEKDEKKIREDKILQRKEYLKEYYRKNKNKIMQQAKNWNKGEAHRKIKYLSSVRKGYIKNPKKNTMDKYGITRKNGQYVRR
jgi:hypothetical protein